MKEDLDKTIIALCNWIQKDVSGNTRPSETTVEMTKALATLITAKSVTNICTTQIMNLEKEEVPEFKKFIRKLNRKRKMKGYPRIKYCYKVEQR